MALSYGVRSLNPSMPARQTSADFEPKFVIVMIIGTRSPAPTVRNLTVPPRSPSYSHCAQSGPPPFVIATPFGALCSETDARFASLSEWFSNMTQIVVLLACTHTDCSTRLALPSVTGGPAQNHPGASCSFVCAASAVATRSVDAIIRNRLITRFDTPAVSRETGEAYTHLIMTGTATLRPTAFSLALGVLGGAALIVTTTLTHRGPMIFLPYTALVLAAAAYLRLEGVQGLSRRFFMALGAFMTATVILYLFIGFVQQHNAANISLTGHAWRLGAMLAIGATLSAAVAQLTSTRVSD